MEMILKTAKFGIIMMLAPAMCLIARPYSTLPPNETPRAGSFFTGLIDDVRIHSAALRTGSTTGR